MKFSRSRSFSTHTWRTLRHVVQLGHFTTGNIFTYLWCCVSAQEYFTKVQLCIFIFFIICLLNTSPRDPKEDTPTWYHPKACNKYAGPLKFFCQCHTLPSLGREHDTLSFFHWKLRRFHKYVIFVLIYVYYLLPKPIPTYEN